MKKKSSWKAQSEKVTKLQDSKVGDSLQLKIVLAGIGAMGSLFAAYLAPQTELILFGHWPEQIATINSEGLRLQLPDKREIRQRIKVTNNPADLGIPDIVLVAVKSTQTTAVARELAPTLPQSTTIITLQNGLGNVEQLTAVFPHNPITLGTTALGATMLRPGFVRQAGFGATHLASSETTAVLLQQFAHTLNSAGLETHLSHNVAGLIWGKLAVNAAINPLTAILRKPNGYLLENKLMRGLMWATAEEVAHLAAFMEIELPYANAREQVTAVAHTTALNHSSMLQDIHRGVPTEIDAICGAVVSNGNRVNYPTPINKQLQKLVHMLENNESSIDAVQNQLETLAQHV